MGFGGFSPLSRALRFLRRDTSFCKCLMSMVPSCAMPSTSRYDLSASSDSVSISTLGAARFDATRKLSKDDCRIAVAYEYGPIGKLAW